MNDPRILKNDQYYILTLLNDKLLLQCCSSYISILVVREFPDTHLEIRYCVTCMVQVTYLIIHGKMGENGPKFGIAMKLVFFQPQSLKRLLNERIWLNQCLTRVKVEFT